MLKTAPKGLSSKLNLKFNSKGCFKILAMSDIQETCNFNPETIKNIEQMLDTQKPDLALLIGDNCKGPKIKSREELVKYVSIVAKLFEDRRIPWAQVWGNHDHDVRLDKDAHQALYMSYPHNVSETVDDISGQSNFVLPIYASNSNDIAFFVWGLDSGPLSAEHTDARFDSELMSEALAIENKISPFQNRWGLVCFDQLMWYYNTSKAFEAELGKKIPGLLATHVAPYEVYATTANPERCSTVGDYPEKFQLATFNSGLFATVLQRGDIKVICSGHSHDNVQCGSYCGITICNDGSIGATCYGEKEHKGARVFELKEDEPGNINTYFVRSMDL